MDEKLIKVPQNGQICLGKQFAGGTYLMRNLPNGEIILIPGAFRPQSHETFFTPEADQQLAAFNEYIKKWQPPQVDKSAEALLEKLSVKKNIKKKTKRTPKAKLQEKRGA